MKHIIKKILREENDFEWINHIPEFFDVNQPWIIDIGPSQDDQLDAMNFLYSKGIKWGFNHELADMLKYDSQYLFSETDFSETDKTFNSYSHFAMRLKKMVDSGCVIYKWEDIKNYYDL